jgi:uncharacterized iron-regulated membrane protein
MSASPNAFRARWLFAVHRWAGLFIGVNVVVLAATGLLLTFHRELDAILGDGLPPPALVAGTGPRPVAELVAAAVQEGAPRQASYVSWSEEQPHLVYVRLEAPAGSAALAGEKGVTYVVDAFSGAVTSLAANERALTSILLELHANLFAGTLGEIYVGLVGLAMAIVAVTGFFVYGPFTKQRAFGIVRRGRTSFVFADLHRALGAATFLWNLVLAATGVFLTLGTLLLQLYAFTELKGVLEASQREYAAAHADAPAAGALLPIDDVLRRIARDVPGHEPVTLAVPGSELAGAEHYLALLRGSTPLERRVLTLGLVHARSGATRVVDLPWYLKAVFVSQPLHFGDYGGLPLRLLWALFSVVTLALSGSGIYLFFARRGRRPVSSALATAAMTPEAEGATR